MTGTEEGFERARDLLRRHGWHASAYQILNPGFRLWFSRDGDAVAGYVPEPGVRVVGTVPVCPGDRLADVAAEFEADAERDGQRVCYVAAEEPLWRVVRETGRHAAVVVGAQPVLDPRKWEESLAGHASLRAQLRRSRNKGVHVRRVGQESAIVADLESCLRDWLDTRGLPPLHFLVEPVRLDTLLDRRMFVAERNGQAIAFLVASPVPCRGGWLVEQIVRRPSAPNGTTELLIDGALRAAGEDGSTFVTLGGAPLSQKAGIRTDEPLWIRLGFTWLRAHGRRFYDTAGLEAFKAKFRPERWEPVYAITNEPRIRMRTMYQVARAFGGVSPVWLALRGVARGVRAEAGWLARRARPR